MRGYVIDKLLRQDTFAKKYFCGVYPADKLPLDRHFQRPACFVVNTGHSSGPGEHWVGVYFDETGKGVYFDSFGLPPCNPYIVQFLNRHCRYHVHNNRMIQSVTATTCGHYCVYFVKMCCRGQGLMQLLKPFHSTELWRNDRFITNWFQTQTRKTRFKPVLMF